MSFCLPVSGVPKEQVMLSSGLYWLFCDSRQDADWLAARLLGGELVDRQVCLLCSEPGLERILKEGQQLSASEARVYTYGGSREPAVFKREFINHPERLQGFLASRPEGIALLRGCLEQEFKHEWLGHRLYRLNQWLKKNNRTLLVIFDSPVRPAIPLNEIAGFLQGCAALARIDAELLLDLFFWNNHLGLFSGLQYSLARQAGGLLYQPDAIEKTARPALGVDARTIVFQGDSLRGLPLMSSHWRVVADYDSLLDQASQGQSATYVFALTHNGLVSRMATDFQLLRASGSTGIKLVVRELVPCLRYSEQKALLLAGASFIVPETVSNQHMLLYLSALQGLEWCRPLVTDTEGLLERSRPVDVRGILDMESFRRHVEAIQDTSMGELTHQLLELRMKESLSAGMVASQMELRRYGDIAAFADGCLYLFLFACPDSSTRQALNNIFHLPLPDLFASAGKVAAIESLTGADMGTENLLERLNFASTQAVSKPAPRLLQPRRLPLPDTGR